MPNYALVADGGTAPSPPPPHPMPPGHVGRMPQVSKRENIPLSIEGDGLGAWATGTRRCLRCVPGCCACAHVVLAGARFPLRPSTRGLHGSRSRKASHAILRSSSNAPPNSAESRIGTAIIWPQRNGTAIGRGGERRLMAMPSDHGLYKRGPRICKCWLS